MKEFYVRLLVPVYQPDLLIPAFTKGITGSSVFIKRGFVRRCVSEQDKDTQGRAFFRITYHLRYPTSKSLQRQWRQHLLHLPWEPPLWRLKNNYKIQIGIKSMCVAYIRPKILVASLHNARLTFSMGPRSRPIWSRDWGPVFF